VPQPNNKNPSYREKELKKIDGRSWSVEPNSMLLNQTPF
jgi:hypothetical protein